MSFEKYISMVSGNHKRAVKVEWLNPDETVKFEFTNSLYDINVDLNVNYQNGSRRSCTLTLKNDKHQFPINFNNLWFGQKFKLWMGIYLDNETPFYIPQGVFYISNPQDIYQPSTKTIKINGVDKWAYLDGTLHGKLAGTYQTNINTDLYDATRSLLKLPATGRSATFKGVSNAILSEFFKVTNNSPGYFQYDNETESYISNQEGSNISKTILIPKFDMAVSFKYEYYTTTQISSTLSSRFYIKVGEGDKERTIFSIVNKSQQGTGYFNEFIRAGEPITIYFRKREGYSSRRSSFSDIKIRLSNDDIIDPTPPFISPYFLTKTTNVNGIDTEVWKCPYTAKVERGKSYADVLLEYATILCAHIYYDANGRLTIEPMIDTADDITDTNKEILWHYTVDEKTLLGLTQTYNFDKVYNDIIVLGNVANGYQFKARVQNQNILSDTCVQKIGLKTKEPIEDNQYYSDEQCKELAIYYAKIDTILQKSGDIESTPLYHLDVNKLVSISTPNNNMSKELFLITGFSLNSSGKMSVNVTSVNLLKDFSVVEVDVYE